MKTLVAKHFVEKMQERHVPLDEVNHALKALQKAVRKGHLIPAPNQGVTKTYVFHYGELRFIYMLERGPGGEDVIVLLTIF